MASLDSRSEAGSLSERIYASLHQDIITGRLPGGAQLIESTLASKMKASRTPVREALLRLASEGLVHHIPRAGYIVEDLSNEDIQDLFAIRQEIEDIVVRRASEKILPGELELLKANLDQTDEILRSGSTGRMIHLDTEFHHILYRATRSKTLFQITQGLSDRTLKFRLACIHFPEVARRAREGHMRIYQALSTGRPEAAERVMRTHLEETREDIINSMKRIREANFMAGEAGNAPHPLLHGSRDRGVD